jgi:uncharacterized protein YjaG (DUF416 family)
MFAVCIRDQKGLKSFVGGLKFRRCSFFLGWKLLLFEQNVELAIPVNFDSLALCKRIKGENMVNERIQNVIERSQNLSREKQILFCLILARRLYPNYAHFQRLQNFGDIGILQACFAAAEEAFFNLPSGNFDKLREDLLLVSPDTGDFPNEAGASYALDACAICDAILCLIEENAADATKRAASLSIETGYIFSLDTGEWEDHMPLENSPTIVREVEYLEQLVVKIATSDFTEVRDLASEENFQVSNIGLS